MRSTSFALLAAAIGLLGIVGGEQGALAGTSWHAQHSVPMSVAQALTDRLHGTSPRQSVISSLASCPDTISCSAGKGAVDRCCSPVMGLLVFVQQVWILLLVILLTLRPVTYVVSCIMCMRMTYSGTPSWDQRMLSLCTDYGRTIGKRSDELAI